MADEQPDELVIQLRKPVALGTETYSELRLREPTGAEMMLWDKLTGTEADIMAVSLVSGVPKPAVEKIGARDLLQASRYIGAFFVRRPIDWRERLDFLAQRYGKMPDEVARRPWSTLNDWIEWAGGGR